MAEVVTFFELSDLIDQSFCCTFYFPALGVDGVLYVLFMLYDSFQSGLAITQDVDDFGGLAHIVD
jgi:hypothetical protein